MGASPRHQSPVNQPVPRYRGRPAGLERRERKKARCNATVAAGEQKKTIPTLQPSIARQLHSFPTRRQLFDGHFSCFTLQLAVSSSFAESSPQTCVRSSASTVRVPLSARLRRHHTRFALSLLLDLDRPPTPQLYSHIMYPSTIPQAAGPWWR